MKKFSENITLQLASLASKSIRSNDTRSSQAFFPYQGSSRCDAQESGNTVVSARFYRVDAREMPGGKQTRRASDHNG